MLDVEGYTQATKSEYHIERRPCQVDTGVVGHTATVEFTFILNALDVVVAKKNNDLAAFQWIRLHTNNNVGE